MRKLTYLVASTLDGFIAGSDGADPSGPEGFWPMPDDYVQHIIDHYPETLPVQARQALGVTAAGECFDTVLEGRRSFQVGLDAGVADAYPHLVTSSSLVRCTSVVTPPSSLSRATRSAPSNRSSARTARTSGWWVVARWCDEPPSLNRERTSHDG